MHLHNQSRQMDDIHEINTYCPICSAPVKKIREVEIPENRKNAVCENEYYIHTKAGVLIKILNPDTLWS